LLLCYSPPPALHSFPTRRSSDLGLYTVLIAAPLIALLGGSRFNVSGPTAAFVVILLPITQQYGLGGLLLCTMLAGMILICLGLRSEEHTSELQSRENLVCRLLLE